MRNLTALMKELYAVAMAGLKAKMFVVGEEV